jgi:hypothetical protein
MFPIPFHGFFAPPLIPVAASPAGESPDAEGTSSKKKFSLEEDNVIRTLVSVWGIDNWKNIAPYLPDRTIRQCRERWKYYLEPGINHTDWTPGEDRDVILQLALDWLQTSQVDALRGREKEFSPSHCNVTAIGVL